MKKILSVILAVLTLFCCIYLCACSFPTDDTPNDTDTEQGDNDDKTSQYTQIFQTVLTDDFYSKVIEDCSDEHGTTFMYYPGMCPAPYFFLEKQGHDISSVKQGKLDCITSIYTQNDDTSKLYMSVRIENDNYSKNYYTNYVLKYSLSKQEYDELYMLYKGNFMQAPLFIQEISRQKTVTVESKINITVDAYKRVVERFKTYDALSNDVFGSKNIDVDVIYAYADEFESKLNTYVRSLSSNQDVIIVNAQLRNYFMDLYGSSNLISNNDIFDATNISVKKSNLDEYKTSYTPITYFNIVNTTANDFLKI
ncbi:MAG: hypothetical protein K2L12_03515 [Clostridia bacterium]|nr:hypothetical protein [Clostridia bacterium]